MAYQLQADMPNLLNPALPPECATSNFFAYPVSSKAYIPKSARPNTMLYGTAPFMAGKGAPHELILVDDELRPQSTKRFGKSVLNTYERNTFPWQDMSCAGPLRTMTFEPTSTRADMQNQFFFQRYPSMKK